jgi:hypothetical protein
MQKLKLALCPANVLEPVISHSLKIRGSATHHSLLIPRHHNIRSKLSTYSVNKSKRLH